MPRPFAPKVVTANDLLDGDVIYLDAQGNWTRALAEARLLTDEAAAEAVLSSAQSGLVVGAYLADAVEGPDGPLPVHFREAFRRTGPSNYAHGKQSESHNV